MTRQNTTNPESSAGSLPLGLGLVAGGLALLAIGPVRHALLPSKRAHKKHRSRRRLAAVIVLELIIWAALVGFLIVLGVMAARQPVVKIMPLGDSITDGFDSGSYRLKLLEKFQADGRKVDFVGSQQDGPTSLADRDHEGHPGSTIAEINAQVAGEIEKYQPDIILLHIGTNDLLQKASGRTTATRLDKLLDTIYMASPKTQVVVASLTPMGGETGWNGSGWQDYNAAIPRVVLKHQYLGHSIRFADMQANPLVAGRADLPDGVHPDAAGYAKMANNWYRVLGPPVTTTPAPLLNALSAN